MIRILTGDCRVVLPTLPECSVDAIVTDPPYELTSARPGGRSEATRGAVMGGFMGMKWDGSGVAFDPETWRQALRVLKPGGHLLAFGGTRTHHRMVCAIEDAGFEVRDMCAWVYGSGYPKSMNPCKCQPHADSGNVDTFGWKLCAKCGEQFELGTALKPALEPICIARKRLIGTVVTNLREFGTGAMNIEGCRIELDTGEAITATGKGAIPCRHDVGVPREAAPIAERPAQLGRWPANLIHDGSAEVLAAFPEAPGQQADISTTAPSPKTSGIYGAMQREGEASQDKRYGDEGIGFQMKPGARRLDVGSAARFFYTAKASNFDRNDGLDGMPERKVHGPSGDGRVWDIPGSKSTARANHHPTVKPTDLMRYLCRLVTPPGGTVLDPFMGSGSTLKAAELEGFSAIGIEIDPAYVEIARRRIASDAPLFAEVSA